MRKLFVFAIAMFALSACSTMQGFGKDVQKVGSAVERAAKK